MYIEFKLADPTSLVRARINQILYKILEEELSNWSQQYKISYSVDYSGLNSKRIKLNSEQAYTVFALTWNTEERCKLFGNNKIEWRMVRSGPGL